jgi:hypothetical protein
MLIVITIMGVIISALAVSFSVIVRTTPTTELRIDDARSVRGLQTYLSHDTTSAPPYRTADPKGWMDTSPGANTCGLPLVAGDYNILELSWREVGFAETLFVAAYRVERTGDDSRIVRVRCEQSGLGWTNRTKQRLTAGLSSTATQYAQLLPDPGTDVESVRFVLTAASGAVVTFETGSRNPVEFYP